MPTTPVPSSPTSAELAQYFTPPHVVRLAYALIDFLSPLHRDTTVLDPSCGAGAFLSGALERGIAPQCLYGLDCDPALTGAWQQRFGQLRDGPHLAVADALSGCGGGMFDVVAGNPPFAGTCELPAATSAGGGGAESLISGLPGGRAVPREVGFLLRSVGLVRPGGLVALVLPEGLFANRSQEVLRRALFRSVQVEAVVGLSRGVFRHTGITVKTCLLCLRACPPAPGHEMRLAELPLDNAEEETQALLELWHRREERWSGEPWTLGNDCKGERLGTAQQQRHERP